MIRGITTRVRVRARSFVALIILAVIGSVIAPSTIGNAQSATALTWPEYAIDVSKFNPGQIITDPLFFDANAMSAAQIQTFLNEKVPTCKSGYTCLKSKKVDTYNIAANPMCKAYVGAKGETAASIIYKVGAACGISQKVILVTLQKEQALVTDTWPSARQYTYALGADCPDTGDGCGATAGFFQQIYRGIYMMKRYTQPAGTGPGTAYSSDFASMKRAYSTVNIQYSPTYSCGTKSVYIANQAAHVLYVYTPYTPNASTLKASWGQTVTCGAYGNLNFFRYYFKWFGDPNGVPPTMQSPPDQSGDVAGQETVGKTLTVAAGRWTGNPTPSVSYQWYSCASQVTKVTSGVPAGCNAIAAATASTYTLTNGDVGRFVAPAVVLRNQSGTAARITPTTAFVYQPPTNTAAPTVSGLAVASSPITVSTGSWAAAPAPSFTYAWKVCASADLKKCSTIKGATTATVKPSKTDVGKYFVATVTATNRSSSSAMTQTATLIMAKPTMTAHAVMSQTPLVGSTVTASTGRWSATPGPGYSFEFFACDKRVPRATATLPGDCVNFVPSQASPIALIPAAIKGKFVVARVTASNGGGSTTDVTASSVSPVIDDPSLPTIAGSTTVGQPLNATSGIWLGKQIKPTLATNGGKHNGYPILGIQDALRAAGYGTPRTGKYDSRTQRDVAKFQRASKFAIADGDVGSATWKKLKAVRTRAVPTFAYQWMACTSPLVQKSLSASLSCADIPGAVSATYTPVLTDQGKYLVVRVTATDADDPVGTRWSLSTLTPIG